MLTYYLHLAVRHIMATPMLSALVVMTLALGVATCTITLSLMYAMSADPIPQKSAQLFRVQLDNWDPFEPAIYPNDPPDQVTWTDANNIVKDAQATRQTASTISWSMVEPHDPDVSPFMAMLRLNHRDFFTMFDTPFLYGGPWDKEAEDKNKLVVVLSKASNDALFAGQNSVGRNVRIASANFKVAGVLNDWHPSPKFFDMSYGAFSEPESMYIPFALKQTFKLPHGGITHCWKNDEGTSYESFLLSECVNYQLWVELETSTEKAEFHNYLDQYVLEQRERGRFPRQLDNRLLNVKQWLNYKEVVPDDTRLLVWLAFSFLFVCLINAASLLSARLSGRASELGLRRALGANRLQIAQQLMLETSCYGLISSMAGCVLAASGLSAIRQMFTGFEHLANLNATMILVTLLVSMLASLLAGIVPIWRASALNTAMQLKVI